MRFRIDLKIFLLCILFYFSRQIETYAIIMIFAIIHELGHLFTGIIVGMKPEKLELHPFGLSVSFKLKPDDYNIKIKNGNRLELKKIIVAIAGPLTNLIVIIIALNLKLNIFKQLIIIYSNVLLILFNILPIYPLDGGRILQGILHINYGKIKSEKIIHNISFTTIIILTAVSSIAILYFKNLSIFLVVLYLWGLIIKEERQFKEKMKLYDILRSL